MKFCPCGTGNIYLACCGKFISLQSNALTPEELMRSRYTAFTLANFDYLARTMKAPAADRFDIKAAKKQAPFVRWTGLKVLHAYHEAAIGWVEFEASYMANGQKQILHEKSEFKFENGQWYYVDGQHK